MRAVEARVTALGPIWGVGAACGGVLLLRKAWSARSGAMAATGWLAVLLGAAGWALAGAALDKAIAFAALVPSLCALAVLAVGAVRPGAPLRLGPAPAAPRPGAAAPARAARLGRGVVRALCIGPLAGAAALAAAVALGVHGAGSAGDRLVAADFATPLVWAGGAVWAAVDPRLARVGAGLSTVAAAALVAAFV